ncbi:MAG: transporter substrate-binding domain-containing protein [Emcibacteraceae bacterium]|nr:transporter substrate-binding domain-containing protein [Emcibacteraceae bacterium]
MYIKNQIFATLLRSLSRLILLSAFLVSFAHIGNTQSSDDNIKLTAEERAWIADHPVVTSSNVGHYVPYNFTKDDKPAGFSIDYLLLVAKKVGLKINFTEPTSWTKAMEQVTRNETDLFHSVSRNDIRDEFLNFTKIYHNSPTANFAKTGSSKINNIVDLELKKIGSIKGSQLSNYFNTTYPQIHILEYGTVPEALDALANSEIDVFSGSEFTIKYYILQNFITGLEDIGGSHLFGQQSIEEHRLASHKNMPILRDILQKGMDAVTDDEFQKIEKTWQTDQITIQSKDIDLTAEERAWISSHPILTASNRFNRPPFDFLRNGRPAGFGIDYLNLLSSKVGLKINYISDNSWANLLEKFKNKDIDIIHSVLENPTRKKYTQFSSPYLTVPSVSMGRIGSPRLNGLSDLKDKRVGVVSGSTLEDLYKIKRPNLELVKFETITDALFALSSSKIDIFTNSLISINYSIVQNFIPGLEIIGGNPLVVRDRYDHRIGIHKSNQILLNILEKAKAIITPMEFQTISQKWLTYQQVDTSLNLTAEELDWLSSHNVISTSTDPNLSPIEFIGEDDEIDGIAGDFLNIIAKKLNIQFKWVGNTSLDEGIEQLVAGTTQVISAIAPTLEREEQFYLTGSYLKAAHMIFSRNDSPIFGNISGIADRRVAQIKGYTINKWVNADYPSLNKVQVDTINEAMRMLSTGEVDAYIGDILTTSYHISRNGYANIIVTGQTNYSGDTVFAISKKHPLLASAMIKAMASITELEKTEIAHKWQSLRVENKIDTDFIRNIIIGALMVLMVILLWNYSLRKEILRRRKLEIDLIHAQRVAEDANDAKSAFLANMSHEIRTPLNAIIGFSEAIMLGIGGKLVSEKHKEYLTDIKNSGEHLAIVIKDILDLSKIEAGKWDLDEEKFSLDNCITSSVKMLEENFRQKSVTITYKGEKSINIYGDQIAIKRVIINLLSNSVKFVDNNGTVSINVSIEPNKDVKIAVMDNGIGIPADRIDHVLHPFEQNQGNHELNDEGTGLGLPIVLKLVELHGGRFILVSEVDVGTTATIILPACRHISD